MSERAKDFVETFKQERLHPSAYEGDDLSESKALAAACYEAAEAAGISKEEIDEEYEDLVSDIATTAESMIDAKVKQLADKGD